MQHLKIHGHQIAFRLAGRGPALVLLHGMVGSSATWRHVMPILEQSFTLLAPDLLGHGDSAKPLGDYSLGAHASTVRDLMLAAGLERATLVGQSFGGGVAMQMAYGSRLELFEHTGHFPHCEEPERFARVVTDFVRATEAQSVPRSRWKQLLGTGGDAHVNPRLTVVSDGSR